MSNVRRLSALFLVLACFVVAPAATAQDTIKNPNVSTPTTLYFHIFDTVNRFVINTQPMDSEFFEVGGANFPTFQGTGSPTPIETGVNLDEGYDMNTIYGYSTAGPVEYAFIENGKPRFHPERGIAADVRIDDSVVPVVYLYIDVRDAIGSTDSPSGLPEFNVRVNVQEGDNPGLDANLDEGRDLMTGTAKVHVVKPDATIDPAKTHNQLMCNYGPVGCPFTIDEDSTPDTKVDQGNEAINNQGVMVGDTLVVAPDANGIVEVVFPLTVLEPTIPKKEAYNVRIDWYQTPDPSGTVVGDDDFTTGWLRLAASPETLPRLELNIFNPVYFSFIHPQVAANTLLIHAGGNSPWGTYDVDIDAVTIEVTHESGKKVPDNQLKKLLNTNEHVHGLHDEDTQMTYLWDFRDHNAALGEYTIKMTMTNDAHSAVASGEAKFIVSETEAIGVDTTGAVVESAAQQEEVDTPSVGLVPAGALLGAALLLARRRWTE